MFKAILTIVVALSFVTTSAFAESSIEVDVSSEEIKSLDSILITGKISGVAEYKPVKLTVMAPDGSIAYSPSVPIGDNGEFRKLLHPTVPSFMAGTYTITASHEDTEVTSQTQFTVISQSLPRNQVEQPVEQDTGIMEDKPVPKSGITLSADAVNGSDTITISGTTAFKGTDITLIVNSPTGNVVTIAQITPGVFGDFEAEIKTGGPLWKEDGIYTITANHGSTSEQKQSIEVEIKDGVVIPEFGTIAAMILAVAIISIIVVSAKSRLSIMPRY